MNPVSIDCPECCWKMEVDEDDLGTTVKCPKCKQSFTAEAGGLYDMVEDPKPKVESWTPPPQAMKPQKPGRPAKKQAAPQEEAEPISDEKLNDLMSNMEKWAEE